MAMTGSSPHPQSKPTAAPTQPQPHPQTPTPTVKTPAVKTPVVRVTPDGAKTATPPAAGAAPAPASKPWIDPKLLYGGIAGVVVVLLAIVLLVWKPWKAEPPRLNEEPWKIAKFVSTPDFKKLPFERQYSYMYVLDDKEPAIAQAYTEKKLNDTEYAAALQAAYLGKHLKRARNYAEKGTARARELYLDKLIEKKKKADKKTKATEPADAEEIKRDDTEEQETINTWPTEIQAQWTAYRMALKGRKETQKEAKADRKAAATQAATRASATAPAEAGKK